MRVLAPLALSVALSVLTASPLLAQDGDNDTLAAATAMPAGTYAVDPAHTLVNFTIGHLGISPFTGQFGNPAGTLTIDPADPSAASVDIVFPIADVSTTSARLDEHLQAEEFFDAANHPEGRFASTAITVDGDRATITGDLTLRGVTKPVVLQATLYGAAENPLNQRKSLGFSATTEVMRSDFGINAYLPALADRVELNIEAAFEAVDDEVPANDGTETAGN
ncbi:MAG: YceI family protein [Pseudomonadota bacterium]